ISRTVVRVIPLQLRNSPEMIGTSEQRWMLATSEVDQYLKGHRNRLSDEE
ncbi:MAG TPA: phosphate ABC transporter, permease protein PstA, partial [Halomonas sp.]|nr:phosphate ABC transporter, permease protein PstA [Halomonas sp.]